MTPKLYLLVAILLEVGGTTALRYSDGFTRLAPSLTTLGCYGASFYFLSLALRGIPMGVAYAIWSGVGIVLIATIGWIFQNQKLDGPAIAGMALIVSGVAVLNLFSKQAGSV